MNNLICCCLSAKDWMMLGLSLLGSLLITALWSRIIYAIKPKLGIDKVIIVNDEEKPRIKIKVTNNRHRSAAINIRIEVCVLIGKYTYHLDIDKSEFIMLPKKEDRSFQSYELANSAKEYYKKNFNTFIEEMIKNTNSKLRVRVYAAHSFSGFGKAFETFFQYDEKSKELKEYKTKN
jgi:hypothetical protein